jgi:hypothetical protein
VRLDLTKHNRNSSDDVFAAYPLNSTFELDLVTTVGPVGTLFPGAVDPPASLPMLAKWAPAALPRPAVPLWSLVATLWPLVPQLHGWASEAGA